MPNLRLKIVGFKQLIGNWFVTEEVGLTIEDIHETRSQYIFDCKYGRFNTITQIVLDREGRVGSLGVPVWELKRYIPRDGITDMSPTLSVIERPEHMLRLIAKQCLGDKYKTI